MNIEKAKKILNKSICPTYGERRLVLEYGSGCNVFDSSGKRYIDLLSGIAVSSLGHSHPKIIEAISCQVKKLIHVSNLYHNIPQLKLSEKLSEIVKNEYKMFYCNSGAEANEAAIKLTRKYMSNPDKAGIITFFNSFHGRTMATVTATGQSKYHNPFRPLPPEFYYADFNNIESVKKLINKKMSAVMIELIQCEGGINLAEKKFVKELAELCKKNRMLLIIDEVQTGTGRTGKFFCFENYGIKPDIVTIAKGIAAGVPMGIMFARKNVAESFLPGDHASTFGGGPLACAAAEIVVDYLNESNLHKIFEKGEYFKKKICGLKHNLVKEVRGIGLIVGIELKKDCGNDIQVEAEKRGLLINSIHNNVIRIVPPLIIDRKTIDESVKILKDTLNTVYSKLSK
ncbi:aspartate aminotransferase family protein [Candidatus Dependentiae bacterium]|nr:aspartate aminotransferase family protein [Candidatus Dependentiae bacterium]